MKRGRVIYMDEYRKVRGHRNLLQMIKGHLAEAGLLDSGTCVCCRNAGESDAAPDRSLVVSPVKRKVETVEN